MSCVTARPVGERDKDGNYSTTLLYGGDNLHVGIHGVMATTKNNWRKHHNAKPVNLVRVKAGTIDTARLVM